MSLNNVYIGTGDISGAGALTVTSNLEQRGTAPPAHDAPIGTFFYDTTSFKVWVKKAAGSGNNKWFLLSGGGDGSGFPGEEGEAGEPGPPGSPGVAGAAGIAGAAGAAGAMGIMGPPGEDGEEGEMGPPGGGNHVMLSVTHTDSDSVDTPVDLDLMTFVGGGTNKWRAEPANFHGTHGTAAGDDILALAYAVAL